MKWSPLHDDQCVVQVFDGEKYVVVGKQPSDFDADRVCEMLREAIRDAIMCDRGLGRGLNRERQCVAAMDGVCIVPGVRPHGIMRELIVTVREALATGGTMDATTIKRLGSIVWYWLSVDGLAVESARNGQGQGDAGHAKLSRSDEFIHAKRKDRTDATPRTLRSLTLPHNIDERARDLLTAIALQPGVKIGARYDDSLTYRLRHLQQAGLIERCGDGWRVKEQMQ